MSKALTGLNSFKDSAVLVSGSTYDDAGVYRVSDELALVQTVDFFTPMVDDPYDFGRIAIANSLSDVYAMGGVPRTAMNVVTFPISCLDVSVLRDILRGGSDKLVEAGVALLGGHTVEDAEPKYGASVTGFVHPDHIWTNGGARVGDVLVLTKKLGVGLVTTAFKGDESLVSKDELHEVTESLAALNKTAAEVAKSVGGVHSCTDITGFGLIGHLLEMVGDDAVTFEVDSRKLPFFDSALDFAREGLIPAGAYRNRDYVKDRVMFLVEDFMELAVVTPETSGGLVFAFSPEDADEYLRQMEAAGQSAWVIGKVTAAGDSKLILF